MNVTIIQTYLFWEDREKNLAHFDALINKITGPTNLIILPEMFTTGFSMEPERIAEQHLTTAYNWLLKKAKEKNAVITGSVAIKDGNNFYNRMHWIEPNGNSAFYDKRHLFSMAKENEKYISGKEKIIKTIGDWNFLPLVCYDLRFPVWSRNKFSRQSKVDSQKSAMHTQTVNYEYDVLIYAANWPEVRSYPWKQLLIARAIENQCYVIGVNRIGKDENGHNYSGESLVINPRGEIINQPKANEESVETITLDRNYLEDFRKNFPVGFDADDFRIL